MLYVCACQPYVTHAVETGRIVCCLVPPTGSHAQQAVAAAILHDVLDDTDCTPAMLQAEFGAEVLALVVSVTRLSQVCVFLSSFSNPSDPSRRCARLAPC